MCETENPSNQAEMFLSPSCTRCLCTASLGLAWQLRGVTGHPKGLAVCIHPPQHVSLGLRAQDGCKMSYLQDAACGSQPLYLHHPHFL